MKEYVVKEDASLKNFTDNVCAQASFCFRTLLHTREIRVNGVKVGANVALRAGDTVRYYMTAAQEGRRAYEVIYGDGRVTVVDKESGVNAEAVFSALSEERETYFIHRLDRNTQGLMIFAHDRAAEAELLDAFRERRTEKIYHALVVGRMPERHEVLTAYLKKDEQNAHVVISRQPDGEKIVTEYEVLSEGAETSLLRVILYTGKTHQIRAHFAFLGHPVAGDSKYGDGAFNRAHNLTRQRLLAKELCVHCTGALSYLSGMRFLSPREL